MYAKNPYEANYQLLINRRKDVDLKCYNDSKDFIEYSNAIGNICKTIEERNQIRKRKTFIVFDGMIADMLSNKNLQHNYIIICSR